MNSRLYTLKPSIFNIEKKVGDQSDLMHTTTEPTMVKGSSYLIRFDFAILLWFYTYKYAIILNLPILFWYSNQVSANEDWQCVLKSVLDKGSVPTHLHRLLRFGNHTVISNIVRHLACLVSSFEGLEDILTFDFNVAILQQVVDLVGSNDMGKSTY